MYIQLLERKYLKINKQIFKKYPRVLEFLVTALPKTWPTKQLMEAWQ